MKNNIISNLFGGKADPMAIRIVNYEQRKENLDKLIKKIRETDAEEIDITEWTKELHLFPLSKEEFKWIIALYEEE